MRSESLDFLKTYLNNASPTGFESSGQQLWLLRNPIGVQEDTAHMPPAELSNIWASKIAAAHRRKFTTVGPCEKYRRQPSPATIKTATSIVSIAQVLWTKR